MPKITLLKITTIDYRDKKHLGQLIQYHRDQLARVTEDLSNPRTIPKIQAIAYNLIHLTRELERVERQGKTATLHVLPGGKTD